VAHAGVMGYYGRNEIQMTSNRPIFIGLNGCVLALDRATGSEIWRTRLPGAGDFVNVALEDGDLIAGAKGRLFCLDAATGEIRWENGLKGLGFGLITIAGSGGQAAVIMRKKKEDDDAAAAAASNV